MSISGELRLDFRECVGAFATGVTVVTTHAQGQPAGMTLNSFTSVSLDPLLVLVSLAHATRTLEAIKSSKRFTVNVLHRNQRDVALAFAKPGAPFPEGYTVQDAHVFVVGRPAADLPPRRLRRPRRGRAGAPGPRDRDSHRLRLVAVTAPSPLVAPPLATPVPGAGVARGIP